MTEIRPVWTPGDFAKLAAHAQRFDTLPAISHEPMLPEHDGDTAELGTLIDLVFAQAQRHHTLPDELPWGILGQRAAFTLGMGFGEINRLERELRDWTDPVPAMLADWPARIITPVIVP